MYNITSLADWLYIKGYTKDKILNVLMCSLHKIARLKRSILIFTFKLQAWNGPKVKKAENAQKAENYSEIGVK